MISAVCSSNILRYFFLTIKFISRYLNSRDLNSRDLHESKVFGLKYLYVLCKTFRLPRVIWATW